MKTNLDNFVRKGVGGDFSFTRINAPHCGLLPQEVLSNAHVYCNRNMNSLKDKMDGIRIDKINFDIAKPEKKYNTKLEIQIKLV